MKGNQNSDIALSIASEFIFGRGRPLRVEGCRKCGVEVPFLTPEDAAGLDWTTADSIFRRIEENDLHFRISAVGTIEVCLASLISLPVKDDQETVTVERLDKVQGVAAAPPEG